MSDKMREEFEVWFNDRKAEPSQFQQQRALAMDACRDIMLATWIASRAALVVELPSRHDQADNGIECFYCDEVEEALTKAGVTVK